MLVYVLYCLIDLRNEIVYVGAPLKLSYASDKNLVIKRKRNNFNDFNTNDFNVKQSYET